MQYTKKERKFTEFARFVMLDFYNNCNRAGPYDFSDERTIYNEIIDPIFKSYGKFTKKSVVYLVSYFNDIT